MDKEEIDIRPSETVEKLEMPDGNSVTVSSGTVNLVKSDKSLRTVLQEMKKHSNEEFFKDIPDEQPCPD